MEEALIKCVGMACLTVIALAIIGTININKRRKDGNKHD